MLLCRTPNKARAETLHAHWVDEHGSIIPRMVPDTSYSAPSTMIRAEGGKRIWPQAYATKDGAFPAGQPLDGHFAGFPAGMLFEEVCEAIHDIVPFEWPLQGLHL